MDIPPSTTDPATLSSPRRLKAGQCCSLAANLKEQLNADLKAAFEAHAHSESARQQIHDELQHVLQSWERDKEQLEAAQVRAVKSDAALSRLRMEKNRQQKDLQKQLETAQSIVTAFSFQAIYGVIFEQFWVTCLMHLL